MSEVASSATPRLTARLVSTIIPRLRGGSDYAVAAELSALDLTVEIVGRIRSLLAAQWRLRGVRGPSLRFCERRVTIQHRRHLSIGRGSVLETGSHLRCLSRDGFVLGRGVTIGKYAILECTGVLKLLGKGLTVGDGSSVGDYSFIGAAGGVLIGRGVLMGQRVSIHAQNHDFDGDDMSIANQGTSQLGITVGDYCWIGSGSIILDGVTLGQGCVVAAGSVVNRSFPPMSVVAGVPARLVKSRGPVRDS